MVDPDTWLTFILLGIRCVPDSHRSAVLCSGDSKLLLNDDVVEQLNLLSKKHARRGASQKKTGGGDAGGGGDASDEGDNDSSAGDRKKSSKNTHTHIIVRQEPTAVIAKKRSRMDIIDDQLDTKNIFRQMLIDMITDTTDPTALAGLATKKAKVMSQIMELLEQKSDLLESEECV